MTKYKLLLTLVCLCIFCNTGIGIGKSYALESEKLILTYDNVTKVDIYAGGPSYSEHQKYNYSTSLQNEIAYILNYINNFHLEDDGKIQNSNDSSSYSIKIYTIYGGIRECGFYSGRFYDNSNRQYAIESNEYKRFLDFIYALKAKKIVLDDEINLEPSEWARDDIDKAIKAELVPKANQINYKGKINRLEVCQLIDNLLDKQNIIKPESTENPFPDTADKSVISLYNHRIIDGKNTSEFAPYDYITREELSKVLSNTYYLMNSEIQSGNCTHKYADQEEISHWALHYINDMYSLNIMMGNPENEFKPYANVTKEELIITLLRISIQ